MVISEATKKAVVEASKECLRVILFAVIPVAIDMLNKGQVDYRLLAVTGAIAGLRFIDSLLHNYGKETGNDTLSGGITRF